MKLNLIIEIISVLFCLLFTYAAVSKLIHYDDFVLQARQYDFLRQFLPVIWIVPVAELTVTLLLIFGNTRLLAFYLSAAVICMFTCIIAYILFTGKHLPCSCGGVIQQMNWKQHLVFNVFFLALALTGIFLEKEKKSMAAPLIKQNST